MDDAARPVAPGASRHVPVLLDRCIELLAPALGAPPAEAASQAPPVVVDATLGMGGHSEALLERLPHVRLVGIDRDPEALALAGERLARFGERAVLVRAVYDELPAVLERLGQPRVQGVLMDLGVSSLQLDEVDRGFSYARDAPLDMRMDPTAGATAADVLNTYDAREISRLLHVYGEERFARRIADAVVRERAREPFTGSARLVELVRAAVPAAARRTGGNPAKRTFQALRIEVNGELDALRAAVPAALDALAVGGRLVVMSYQSLEDRIVKQALAAGAASTSPPGLPVELPEHAPVPAPADARRRARRRRRAGGEPPLDPRAAAGRRARAAGGPAGGPDGREALVSAPPAPPRARPRALPRVQRAPRATRAAGGARSTAPLRQLEVRSGVGTVLLCGAVLLAALLVALWLNIALSRGSYTQHDLAARQTQLGEQEQTLSEHLQAVSAPGPARAARRAARHGRDAPGHLARARG